MGLIPPFGLRPPFGTVGVGNKEDPVAEVRGTNGGSWETVPFRIEPEAGQVAQNSAEEAASGPAMSRIGTAEEAGDIFSHHPAGPSLANNAGELAPEVALVGAAEPLARKGVRLAGEAAAEHIHSGNSGGCDVSYVMKPPGVGPMLGEYPACKFVLLGLPEGVEGAGHFQAQFQPADAAEQAAHGHHSNHS